MTEYIMQKNVTIPSHYFIETPQHPLLLKRRIKSNELKLGR